MKTILKLFAGLFCLMSIASANAAPETYTLDDSHTYVLYHISHFGFSNQAGKWYASGTLVLDETKPQDSKVDVTIKMADLDTGNKELDDHLKGPQFFDVQKYPTATFVSNKITVTNKHAAKVEGMLTMHGVTKPVTLNVTLNQLGENPITNKKTAGFAATADIKRSDFGMLTFLPGLGDDVKLNIEAEAYKVG